MTTATWTVPVDHAAFAGHFPGRPIVPGVLLLDRALRCVAAARGSGTAGWLVANCKFLSPVGPGETLTFTWQATPGGAVDFVVAAAGRVVASGLVKPPAGS
jgi:3-hydroxymyristoyl/3-hydroxydecanoyl-(acyl carrier protein) dehydratase